MRVTIKATSPTEAILVVNAGKGTRITLPVQLIADAPAGVWTRGRLEHVLPSTEALRTLDATEQGLRAALCL